MARAMQFDRSMKTTDKPETLPTINTAALDNVTGRCAACGQDCAKGAAPTQAQQPPQQQSWFGAAQR